MGQRQRKWKKRRKWRERGEGRCDEANFNFFHPCTPSVKLTVLSSPEIAPVCALNSDKHEKQCSRAGGGVAGVNVQAHRRCITKQSCTEGRRITDFGRWVQLGRRTSVCVHIVCDRTGREVKGMMDRKGGMILCGTERALKRGGAGGGDRQTGDGSVRRATETQRWEGKRERKKKGPGEDWGSSRPVKKKEKRNGAPKAKRGEKEKLQTMN